MTRRDLPNIISMLRVMLVWPVVLLLLHGDYGFALLLFAVAGISDGIDGFLAKHYGWESRLGSILDPIADKLLLVCSFIVLGYTGLLPIWLVIVVLLRDFVIMFGAVAYYLFIGNYAMEPSISSKINTFMEIVLVFVVIISQLIQLPESILQGLIGVTAVTILVSGLGYILVWSRRAILASRKNKEYD